MIQTISQTLTQDLQTICNHFVTNSPFLEAIHLTGIEENRHTVHYVTGSNWMLFYGENIWVHVPIYCCPKKNNKQMSYLSSFPLRTADIVSIIACVARSKKFLQLKHAADGRIGKMHKTTFFLSARRRSAGRAGPGGFVDFRCGSRTLWFLTSRTLCLPTLGWILSQWILCPGWACKITKQFKKSNQNTNGVAPRFKQALSVPTQNRNTSRQDFQFSLLPATSVARGKKLATFDQSWIRQQRKFPLRPRPPWVVPRLPDKVLLGPLKGYAIHPPINLETSILGRTAYDGVPRARCVKRLLKSFLTFNSSHSKKMAVSK